jgi:hypothetical protein
MARIEVNCPKCSERIDLKRADNANMGGRWFHYGCSPINQPHGDKGNSGGRPHDVLQEFYALRTGTRTA